MATQIEGAQYSFKAYADYHTNQFCAVYINSDARARLCALNGNAIGILQNNDASAQDAMCTVMVSGISKCKYGDAVTAGQALKCGAAGTLVPQDSTNPIVGVAVVSGASGDIGEVLLDVKGPSIGSGKSYGQLSWTIPIAKLAATGYVYEALPLNIAGTLVDIFAVATSVCAATTGSTAKLEVRLGAAGHTSVGTLAIPVTQLTEANVEAFGTKMSSTGAVTSGGFVATDLISVYVTQGSTQFGGSDTGSITLFATFE